jgi:hypothetical protein
MKNLIIIKDVLPATYWRELYNVVAHPDFPWVYSPEVSVDVKENPFKQNPDIIASCGFTNTLQFDNKTSPYWNLVKPMIYIMAHKSGIPALTKSVTSYRCKANLQTQMNASTKDNYNMPHIDPAHFEKEGDNWVFLYYLHDCDGETFIFNETAEDGLPEKLTIRKRIMPKANTGILFRDNIFHASSNPIHHKRRMNLNFNLLVG